MAPSKVFLACLMIALSAGVCATRELKSGSNLAETLGSLRDQVNLQMVEDLKDSLNVEEYKTNIYKQVIAARQKVADVVESVQATVAEKKDYIMDFTTSLVESVKQQAYEVVADAKTQVDITVSKIAGKFGRETILASLDIDGILAAVESVKQDTKQKIATLVDTDEIRAAAVAAASIARERAVSVAQEVKGKFNADDIKAKIFESLNSL